MFQKHFCWKKINFLLFSHNFVVPQKSFINCIKTFMKRFSDTVIFFPLVQGPNAQGWVELLRNIYGTFKQYIFRYIFKIGIRGLPLAKIEKVAIRKGEILS